ncbi:MAG: YidB family protein [Gaiellaceae bacterium]
MAGLGDILGGLLGGSRKSSGSVGGSGGGGLGDILGGLMGGSGGNAMLMAALLPVVLKMLKGGGLGKILSGAQAQGLTTQADSWVGKGENQSVSADQLTNVLGGDQVAKIAKKVGASQSDTAGALAQLLPQVINHVTPSGQVPEKGDLKGMLKELMKAAS